MGAIVCATRGGEGSRANQQQAVARAQERGEPLTFLYVVDIQALRDVDITLHHAVRSETRWLAQTILRIAKQRAEQAGLDAQIVIREGNVQAEIERFLREVGASLLLLGAPRDTTLIFGDDAIERFAQEIEDNTNVPVEIVPASMPKNPMVNDLVDVETRSDDAITDSTE